VNKLLHTTAVLFLCFCPKAHGREYDAQGDELLRCYTQAALKYALKTCEPAATVIDATFGSCGAEEEALRRAVDHAESSNILRKIQSFAKPKLTALVLDTRVKAEMTCH
jgi:hypothetical protein